MARYTRHSVDVYLTMDNQRAMYRDAWRGATAAQIGSLQSLVRKLGCTDSNCVVTDAKPTEIDGFKNARRVPIVVGLVLALLLVAIPFVDTVAGVGLARANAAGLSFTYEPSDRVGVATVTIGPAV